MGNNLLSTELFRSSQGHSSDMTGIYLLGFILEVATLHHIVITTNSPSPPPPPTTTTLDRSTLRDPIVAKAASALRRSVARARFSLSPYHRDRRRAVLSLLLPQRRLFLWNYTAAAAAAP